MPRPKRILHSTAIETTSPPHVLPETHSVARISKACGNNLYAIELPAAACASKLARKTALVEMPPRFRSSIWVKKGSFVVVDLSAMLAEDNESQKVGGEIVNVVREEKRWRSMAYWPEEFAKPTISYNNDGDSDEEEEESLMGKMPPSDDSEPDT